MVAPNPHRPSIGHAHRQPARLGLWAALFASALALPLVVWPAHAVDDDPLVASKQAGRWLFTVAGTIDPLSPGSPMTTTPATSRYGVVQYLPGRDAQARATLAAAGIEIVGHLPSHAYQVRWNGAAPATLARTGDIRWSGYFPASWKRSPLFAQTGPAASPTGDPQRLSVTGFRGEPLSALATGIRKRLPGVVIEQTSETDGLATLRLYLAEADAATAVEQLLPLDGLAWVEPYLPPQLLNLESVGPIQGNQPSCLSPSGLNCPDGLLASRAPLWQRGLLGTGQIVAVADSGLDRNEPWFIGLDWGTGPVEAITDADDPAPVPPATGLTWPDRKVYAYWVQPGASAYDDNEFCPSGGGRTGYHGTHVVGSVLGDTAPYATPTQPNYQAGEGMAPNAQVLFQDQGIAETGCLAIADFPATLAQARAGGAGIHSNSWGSSSSGWYVGLDQGVDASQWLDDTMLVVVAAGNSGPVATTTGSPGNAKNVLTVGALAHGHSNGKAAFSSAGPTQDGRRKPDLMAPGSVIVSAAGNDENEVGGGPAQTSEKNGTSMATPTVSGGAALLRQYLAEGWYPLGRAIDSERFDASGPLMKALLINGTAAITVNWPDHNIGWGRLWLERSVHFQGDGRGLRFWDRANDAGLETGDVEEFQVELGAGEELRATLTWFDPEAAIAADVALINDLDLELVAPNGDRYRGNHLQFGQSVTGGQPDRRDNVEHVRLASPQAGTWTVRVLAHHVPGNGRPTSHRQGYALALSGRIGTMGDRLFADGFTAQDDPRAPAPATLAVTANALDGIALSVAAVDQAQAYQVFRADGTCATAVPAAFRFAGENTGTDLVDERSQGGQLYAYRSRAIVDGVPSPLSAACVEVVSQDQCSMRLDFDTTSLLVDAVGATCAASLGWSAASSHCPDTTVQYRIWRDSTPLFENPVLLATQTDTTYVDTDVSSGQPVFYRVDAFDEQGNARQSMLVGTTPVGEPGSTVGVWRDDADAQVHLGVQWPWGYSNALAADGQFAYRSALSSIYPPDSCGAVTTPLLTLASGTPTLRYKARWQLEADWDGVAVEISTDDGATWQAIDPDGGYPGSFGQTGDPPANACGFPASQGAFNGESPGYASGSFVEASHSLAAWAGQAVRLRWRQSTDPAELQEGFVVDDIRLDAVLPQACTGSP